MAPPAPEEFADRLLTAIEPLMQGEGAYIDGMLLPDILEGFLIAALCFFHGQLSKRHTAEGMELRIDEAATWMADKLQELSRLNREGHIHWFLEE